MSNLLVSFAFLLIWWFWVNCQDFIFRVGRYPKFTDAIECFYLSRRKTPSRKTSNNKWVKAPIFFSRHGNDPKRLQSTFKTRPSRIPLSPDDSLRKNPIVNFPSLESTKSSPRMRFPHLRSRHYEEEETNETTGGKFDEIAQICKIKFGFVIILTCKESIPCTIHVDFISLYTYNWHEIILISFINIFITYII